MAGEKTREITLIDGETISWPVSVESSWDVDKNIIRPLLRSIKARKQELGSATEGVAFVDAIAGWHRVKEFVEDDLGFEPDDRNAHLVVIEVVHKDIMGMDAGEEKEMAELGLNKLVKSIIGEKAFMKAGRPKGDPPAR